MKIKDWITIFIMFAVTKPEAKSPLSLRFFLESVYNDALFYKEGDFVTFINPFCEISYKKRKFAFSANTELRQFLYHKFSEYNDTGYGYAFNASFSPLENIKFDASTTSIRSSTLTPKAKELLGIWTERRAVYIERSKVGSFSYSGDIFSLSFMYKGDEFEYKEVPQDNNKGREGEVSARWKKFRLQPLLKASFEEREYPLRDVLYKTLHMETGLMWMGEEYTFSTSFGRTKTEAEEKTAHSLWDIEFRKPFTKAVFTSSYKEKVDLRPDIADVVKSRILSIEGGRAFRPKTIGFFFLGYGKDKFMREKREDTIWAVSIGCSFRFREWLSPLLFPFAKTLSLSLRYDFVKRDSTKPEYSHKNNIYTLSVRTSL